MHPSHASHIPSQPTPPGTPDYLIQRGGAFRRAVRRAQLIFLTINAVPFVIGIVLSSFTDIPEAQVNGQFTLGLAWGLVQVGLFIATAAWYDRHCARSCDPLNPSRASETQETGSQNSSAAADIYGW